MTSKLCRHPGCCGRALPGTSYCERHGPVKDTRPPASQRGYGGDWRAIRAAYMDLHPHCQDCEAQGRYVVAQEVHHITPIAEGGDHSEGNLRSLCLSCHRRITFGRG